MNEAEKQYKQYEDQGELNLISQMDDDNDVEMYDDETCKELGLGKYDPMRRLMNDTQNGEHE